MIDLVRAISQQLADSQALIAGEMVTKRAETP
jgi:hypothetical protein